MTTVQTAAWASDDPRVSDILDILAKESGVLRSRLEPNVSIAALDIASLDMVQAIFAIETRFGVEIPVVAEQSGAEFATVGELVHHVLATIERAPPV